MAASLFTFILLATWLGLGYPAIFSMLAANSEVIVSRSDGDF